MIPFFSTTILEGPVAKSLDGGDISPFIGFPVAALLYLWLCRDLDVDAENKIADEQRALLEAEARAHVELGGLSSEDLLEDVGARVPDELSSVARQVTD